MYGSRGRERGREGERKCIVRNTPSKRVPIDCEVYMYLQRLRFEMMANIITRGGGLEIRQV